MTRQEQKDARREQILDAGLDLFVRNGYHGTTSKEIAEALGISPGLMFHYFKSKDELYIELLTSLTKGMTGVAEMFDPARLNPLEIFEQMIGVILDSFRTFPRSAKYYMLVVQAKVCTRLTDGIKAAAQSVEDYAFFQPLIAAGQASGVIRGGDPAALAGLIHSALQGVAHTHVCFPDIPLPDTRWIVDMLRPEA